MLNLFVLIILNNFEANYINPDNPLKKFKEDKENFTSSNYLIKDINLFSNFVSRMEQFDIKISRSFY